MQVGENSRISLYVTPVAIPPRVWSLSADHRRPIASRLRMRVHTRAEDRFQDMIRRRCESSNRNACAKRGRALVRMNRVRVANHDLNEDDLRPPVHHLPERQRLFLPGGLPILMEPSHGGPSDTRLFWTAEPRSIDIFADLWGTTPNRAPTRRGVASPLPTTSAH